MTKTEILNMSTGEFIKQLNDTNYEYVSDHFDQIWQGLDMYQEGAIGNGEDEYISVNEYYDLIREQEENGEESF